MSLTDLRKLVTVYVDRFNNVRIPRNKNGLTPVEYRHQTMAA
ncbi:IS3 family transposase [Loigolactobacillus binensis]|uniref:IS3 family transposase n=1 Tax=Loigolactobacillus binensis TaxID=2559922 RepID=A0ABW3EDG4_9LACO